MKDLIKRLAAVETSLAIGFVKLTLTAALTLGATVSVATVPIISYDIEQTPRSGWGLWCHNYNGTIVNTGRTVSGFGFGCNATDGNQIANYSGGSGTLNDGVITTSPSSTHLFTMMNADDGQPISPVITLHLGGTFVINSILLFGGDIGGNGIPGALNGVTVEIGGTVVTLATVPVGAPNAIGVPVNDLVDLTNTALAGVSTDRIVLRNFTASIFGFPFDQVSITEITIDGEAAPAFAGTPGNANCHGKSVSALAKQFGGIAAAAAALEFESVQELQRAIQAFCREQ